MNKDVFALKKEYFKAFVGLLLFSLLYILPIILANFYYIDDLGRSLRGYTGWNGNGRPLASLLAIIFSNGKPLMDISPWIQIAAIITLDYSLILFIKKYTPKATVFQIVGIASCGYLNLFLLENLSYKYDSLGMIISLSIFLVLYSLPELISNKKQMLFSVGAVVISLSLYQASIGAYFSLAIVECIYFIYKNECWKNIIRRVILRSSGILGGGILYKEIIAKIYVSPNGYSAEHASFINLLSTQGIQRVYANSQAFWEMFKAYGLTVEILGVLLLLVLCIGVLHLIYFVWHYRKDILLVKIISVLLVFISPILLTIMAVIMLILLDSPVIAPRVMISFTIVTLFIGFIIYQLSELKKAFLIMFGIIIICSLSFSSYYGNLLTRQERMNSLVTTCLVYDINQIEEKQGEKINTVSFIGHMPKCPELLLASKKRPLLERLIPIYMNNNWIWGGEYLSHYRKEHIQIKEDKDDKNYVTSSTPLRYNEFYQLYVHNNKLIVLFLDA